MFGDFSLYALLWGRWGTFAVYRMMFGNLIGTFYFKKNQDNGIYSNNDLMVSFVLLASMREILSNLFEVD